jgi:pimeloyl-ACP methyl ester carboxylesterase
MAFYKKFLLIWSVLVFWGCGASSDFEVSGTWLGTIEEADVSTRVVFNLARAIDGKHYGTVDVPEEGQIALPLDRCEVLGRHVDLGVSQPGATFSGDLSDDGTRIEGILTQASQTMSMVMHKQPGRLDYRRPQDPVPPYPYNHVDVSFDGGEPGMALAGTLTWPQGTGPFRAAILIAGSGPNNRDEEMLNHRPFHVLADALTRAGIATLRYDKRGVGRSRGNYNSATSFDFASDARAAARYLLAQANFPVERLGFIGHSEGGLIGPLAAEGNPDVSFLVLLAGPAVRGDEILVSQRLAIGALQGMDEAVLATNEAFLRRIYACFFSTTLVDELRGQLRVLLAEAGMNGVDLQNLVAEFTSPWMRTFVVYDPAPVLTRTQIPVLALNGSLDSQVLPGLNLPAIRKALQDAGNTHATVQELPGLNHLFQHATTGDPSEYGRLTETMSPEVLTQVGVWIAGLE